ncbi:MAG: group II intron reverse transcriptase/maturase [Deltaproteobacteria bacterium]|nr:group II intron reverse transcriptase/maturase [Deltaproteobacteria bacterium]
MPKANGPFRPTDWTTVNWQKNYRMVRNLRQRIFRATQEKNWNTVHSLQKLMLRCKSNRLDSVRRVTQVNAGKNTAGVDKIVIKTPEARGNLVDYLASFHPWRAKPAKRVYIPKSGGNLRPLGIPTITDRCLQAMVKNALEPSWESRFEASSYGFRPGRGCHDAIANIYTLANPKNLKKWVVDADIKGCFDNIDHEFLLKTIGPVPGRELIKQWLKAGYVDKQVFYETEAGTPQGGVISPLLANMALHGMDSFLSKEIIKKGRNIHDTRAMVRYADDFVVFCESKEDAEQAKKNLTRWLDKRGLSLSNEKTRIVHLTEGFDFLGFNIRHYKDARTKTGHKLLIKPSKKSEQKIRDRLRDEWITLQGSNVGAVTKKLNPIIRGWANYFRSGVSSAIFSKLDSWMFHREKRYANRAHPTKPGYWKKKKYWGRLNPSRKDNWVFGDKNTGIVLQKFAWFPIERHVMVKGESSPDDPRLTEYWAKRNAEKRKDLAPSLQKVAQNQKCVCPVCRESLFNGEELHTHHVIPKSQGGKDTYTNLKLVHLYCHQQVTKHDPLV